jgi:hypothetical protein
MSGWSASLVDRFTLLKFYCTSSILLKVVLQDVVGSYVLPT